MTYSLIAAAAAPADALNIGSELLSKQWGGSLEARKAQLLQKNFSWLLVESADHNNVLGHVKLTPAVQTNSDVYGTAPSGVLTSVVIRETHRGQGVGTHLMRSIERVALKLGYYTLVLWTPDAKDFYSRLGYVPCEPRRSLSTLVASVDSISVKAISKLEQMLAKRAAAQTSDTTGMAVPTPDAHNADTSSNMVWMQKRIKDEVPLQDIPLRKLLSSIQSSVSRILHNSPYSAEGAVLHLHCTSKPSAGPVLPWAHQVGPSCGIQVIRFAESVLNSTSCVTRTVLGSTSGSTNVCVSEGFSGEAADHVIVGDNNYCVAEAEIADSNPSLLSVAIELGYTSEGALYHIQHIVDLISREIAIIEGGEDKVTSISAQIQPVAGVSAGQLCNLILRSNNSVSDYATTTTTDTAYPAYVIFPYDRDSTYSTPSLQAGVAAHYALLCGFIILAQPGLQDGAEEHTDGNTRVDYAIDSSRVLLVAMHGLSWQPIVAPYVDFVASNAQLHCKGDKYVHCGCAPTLSGNMVVVRRSQCEVHQTQI